MNKLARNKFEQNGGIGDSERAFLAIAKGIIGKTGQKCFEAICTELNSYLGSDLVFIGKIDLNSSIKILGASCEAELHRALKLTCESSFISVLKEEDAYVCWQNLRKRFPDDQFLESIKANDFIGVAIKDEEQNLQGFLAVFSQSALPESPILKILMGILGEKIRSEFERIEFEQTIYESETKLGALIDSVPGVVYRCLNDRHWSMVYINDYSLKLFGYSPDEFVGFHTVKLGELIFPEDRKMVWDAVQEGLDKRETYIINYRIKAKNDEIKWVYERGQGVFNEAGELIFLEGVITDVSKIKQMDEEKERLEKQLRQAYKMEALGTLTGGIAHDFNNILSAIMGYTELAKNDILNVSSAQSCLDEVLKATIRAKELIKQLLVFSHKQESKFEAINVISTIKEALKLVRASIPSTIKIISELDFEDAVIYADSTQIHQIIMNLVTNAYHAMEKETGTIDVSTYEVFLSDKDLKEEEHEYIVGKYFKLSISDSGSGIAPNIVERIFDPYFTTKNIGEGSGMGLSIVKGIVENHNGLIKVFSEIGKGTRFDLFFPAIKQDLIEDNNSQKAVVCGTERILFVDDEEMLREIASKILSGLGYDVTVCNNGKDALELILRDEEKFDLIITDQTMPEITGLTLAQKLSEKEIKIPIILCSGILCPVEDEKVWKVGVKDFLLKPFSGEQLAQIVRKILDKES